MRYNVYSELWGVGYVYSCIYLQLLSSIEIKGCSTIPETWTDFAEIRWKRLESINRYSFKTTTDPADKDSIQDSKDCKSLTEIYMQIYILSIYSNILYSISVYL